MDDFFEGTRGVVPNDTSPKGRRSHMAWQLADFPGAALLLEHLHGKLLPEPLTTVALHCKELRQAVLTLGQVIMRIDQGKANELPGQLGQERIASPLSEFFSRLRLEAHVGCSPSALRTVMQTLEHLVLETAAVWEQEGIA